LEACDIFHGALNLDQIFSARPILTDFRKKKLRRVA